MIGSRRMVAAAGAQGYLARALGTQPTYFWPLQGETDLTDVVSGEVLENDGSSYVGRAGPGMLPDGDLGWWTSGNLGLMDADYSINANENTGSYSLGGWFYRANTTASDAYISNYTGGAMIYNSSSLYRMYHQTSNTSVSATIPLNSWTHMITTYDASDQRIRAYLNGALIYTSTSTYSPGLNSVTRFRIGGYGTGSAEPTGGGAAWAGWWVGKALSLNEVQILAGI